MGKVLGTHLVKIVWRESDTQDVPESTDESVPAEELGVPTNDQLQSLIGERLARWDERVQVSVTSERTDI